MTQKIRGLTYITTAALLITFLYLAVNAAEPGSEQDPLVSKSYVDSKIQELLTANTNTGGGAAFVPVNLSPGQILIGGEGTEIILRSGRGVAYHTGEDGLVNVTEGKELFNGYDVSHNNLLIVPRADGRGVLVFDSAWLIVKGSYYVTN